MVFYGKIIIESIYSVNSNLRKNNWIDTFLPQVTFSDRAREPVTCDHSQLAVERLRGGDPPVYSPGTPDPGKRFSVRMRATRRDKSLLEVRRKPLSLYAYAPHGGPRRRDFFVPQFVNIELLFVTRNQSALVRL